MVFISHSAGDDPAALRTLEATAGRLVTEEFDVLLDLSGLEGSDDWRRSLHT